MCGIFIYFVISLGVNYSLFKIFNADLMVSCHYYADKYHTLTYTYIAVLVLDCHCFLHQDRFLKVVVVLGIGSDYAANADVAALLNH